MGKELTYKGKLNILLISYSFVVTMVVLILGFILISKIEKPVVSGNNNYFVAYTSDEISAGIGKGNVSTTMEKLVSKVTTSSDLQREYNKEIITSGIIIMVAVFGVVMIISIVISKLISRKVIYPIETIASHLPDIINGNNESIEKNIFVGELSGIGSILEQSSERVKTLLTEANIINSYITHEQKNTLAILRAKLQLGEREELIGIVDKMSCSLDDILALNATDKFKYNDEVDLGIVCAEAVDIYRKVYSSIELDIDDYEIPLIKGRELWIYRAVCNLIENAIKYGNNSEITVKVYNQKGSAIICVEDRGNGIEQENIDKVFNHKYRGENLKKDGYGIGLSLVSHITNLCDGVTFVESEINKGSKFYMVFKALTID